MINLGNIEGIITEQGIIYNLIYKELHIEVKIKENEKAVIRERGLDEHIKASSDRNRGKVARLEINTGDAEIRVKSLNKGLLEDNLCSCFNYKGAIWNLDVYNTNRDIGETFHSIVEDGSRNSFDYAEIYIELNLGPGQEDLVVKPASNRNPSAEELERLLKASFGNSINITAEVVRTENKAKAGRNKPCPCGSGIKYKKCCGR